MIDRSGDVPEIIWTRAYALLGATVFLAYANQMALTPVIPLYVRHLGGSELVAGLILGSFSLASFLLRPRIGRLVDDWDAGRVLLIGCLLLGAATISMLTPVLMLIFIANVMRGIGWAGLNTGSAVLLAQLSPPTRRGESSGYFSLFQSGAATVAPALALYFLAGGVRFATVFIVSAVCAVAALAFARPLAQAPIKGALARARDGQKRAVIARSTMLPSLLLVFIRVPYPAIMGFVPLYAQELGISDGHVTGFYVASGGAAMVGRAVLGQVSDRVGRGAALAGGLALMAVAFLALARGDARLLILVAVVYAMGQGMAHSTLTALAIDRADPKEIGVAMATFSAAYQVGAGLGGVASGVLINLAGYQGLYAAMTLVLLVGLVVTYSNWAHLRGPGRD